MPETFPVQFTAQESWFIQQALPHLLKEDRLPGLESLATQVNDGLAFCYDTSEEEATILLGEDECRLIQAVIRTTMFDVEGQPIGRDILLKSFRASRALRTGEFPVASTDGPPLTKEQTLRLLAFQEVFPDESTTPDS